MKSLHDSGGSSKGQQPRPPLTIEQLTNLKDTPGVLTIVAHYDLAGCGSADAFCRDVFVGTCDQLSLVQVVPGCRDDRINLINDRFVSYAPGQIKSVKLASRIGETVTVRPGAVILRTDDKATEALNPNADFYGLFIPHSSPQIAPIVQNPTDYLVLTGPGEAPRQALTATAAEQGFEVELQYLGAYRDVQAYQFLVWTLAAIVLGIGLLAVLLTTIDRAIERRREIASQVALGVPLRVLRGSQLLQTLLPLSLGLVASIGLGYLTVMTYLKMADETAPALSDTIATMTIAATVSATIMAIATLPGIGGRLTPDLLRHK